MPFTEGRPQFNHYMKILLSTDCKTSRLTGLFMLVLAFTFTSCQQEQQLAETTITELENPHFLHDENEDGHLEVPDLGLEDVITDHVAGHSIDVNTLDAVTLEHPDGTREKRYLLEGDITLTAEEIESINQMVAGGEKQYRTSALVSPQVVSVIGYTGGSYALTSKMRTALQWAINNYNALGLNLTFTLSYSASTNADIVVYRNYLESGAGGSAGFPSGGQPYKWVQIYAGMQNYDTNTNEHVMTHEIGHALGLRHTDYFSRQSCGSNTNEGSAGVGAIHIPGTPTGYDANSVMLACFSSGEDGEFGYYDRVALRYLY